MAFEPKEITPRIYQGGWPLTQDIPEFVKLGMTDILNLDLPYTDPLPFVQANLMLHNVQILDGCLMTPQLVREVMEVIDRILSSPNHKIYIHCNAGVSRSPTISWLYLIHTGLSPEEATSRVKPNPVLYDRYIVQMLIANREG
ncbi:MAG: dual specificity protein phosphatase family protein [Thermodesulfobacteriota bacterium]